MDASKMASIMDFSVSLLRSSLSSALACSSIIFLSNVNTMHGS